MTTYIITKRLSLSFGNCKTFDPERAPCSIVTQLNKLNNNRTLAEISNRLFTTQLLLSRVFQFNI